MPRFPRRRAAFVLGTAAALVLSACSAGSAASSDSASASAAARRDLHGTVTPVANSLWATEAGLTRAAMSIEAEENAVVLDEAGLTYVEPRRSPGADLVVRRVLWDGTQAWTATVPVEVDTTGLTLELSQDPGLGVVALWFSAADPDTGGPAIILRSTRIMASDLTWFDLATGEQGTQDLRAEALTLRATASRSDGGLIGAMHTDSQDSSAGLTYLSADRTMVTSPWSALTDSEGGLPEVAQWTGSPLFVVETADSTASLHLGGVEVLTGLSTYPRITAGATRVAVADGDRLWLVDQQGVATELDTGGCDLGTERINMSSISSTHAYVGLARVDLLSGAVECLEALAPASGTDIMGALSDGSLLLYSTAEEGQEGAWLVPADRSAPRPLGSLDPVEVLSDRIVDTVLTEDGTTVVNAFDYRDLLPQD